MPTGPMVFVTTTSEQASLKQEVVVVTMVGVLGDALATGEVSRTVPVFVTGI